MRRVFLSLVALLACSSVRAQWAGVLAGSGGGAVETPIAADVFIDMSGATAGDLLNPTNLAAGTHGTYSPPWTTSPDPLVGFTAGTSTIAMLRPVAVRGGSTYSTAGLGLRCDASKTLTVATIPIPNSATVVVGGDFDFSLPSTGGANDYRDMMPVLVTSTPTTAVFVAQFTSGGSSGGGSGYRIRIECADNLGTHHSSNVTLNAYGKYRVNMRVQTALGQADLDVYDCATRLQVGTATLTVVPLTPDITGVEYGNGEAGTGVGFTQQQNLFIDYTVGTWPVPYTTLTPPPANPLIPVALTKGANGSGATTTITGSVTSGDTIFVGVTAYGGTQANHTVTCSGNSPAMIAGIDASGRNTRISGWWFKAASTGSITINVDAGSGAVAVVALGHKVTGLTGAFTTGEDSTNDNGTTTNPNAATAPDANATSVAFGFLSNDATANPQYLINNGTGASASNMWYLADTTNSQELNGNTYLGAQVLYQIRSGTGAKVCYWSTDTYTGQVAVQAVLH